VTLLRLDRVTCAYGSRPAVADVSLAVEPSDFLGVVGPSGSGKTTLLRTMLGTVKPRAGTVWRRPGLTVGYVPQVETVNWAFPVTVAQTVLMARTRGRILPWASSAERRAVAEVLDRLGLTDLGPRHIGELSGGQQQRVFIARALLGEPDLLIMDEPTSGVDVRTRHEILHLLADLHHDGLSVVLSTHDLNGIAAHLDRLVCLNVSVTGSGPPKEVLTAEVLEKTYGAPMDVLEHGGMPLVVDRFHPRNPPIVPIRRSEP
jgi:ABC-type Mn2+/Zn2+ transport system ATPase subunit